MSSPSISECSDSGLEKRHHVDERDLIGFYETEFQSVCLRPREVPVVVHQLLDQGRRSVVFEVLCYGMCSRQQDLERSQPLLSTDDLPRLQLLRQRRLLVKYDGI